MGTAGWTLCLAALKRVSELSVESLLILFIKDLKLMMGCFPLLYGKCSSVLPSEVQRGIGSRVCFGCASHGQPFLYGENLKWKQGIVLFLGLAKNSLQIFPAEFSG